MCITLWRSEERRASISDRRRGDDVRSKGRWPGRRSARMCARCGSRSCRHARPRRRRHRRRRLDRAVRHRRIHRWERSVAAHAASDAATTARADDRPDRSAVVSGSCEVANALRLSDRRCGGDPWRRRYRSQQSPRTCDQAAKRHRTRRAEVVACASHCGEAKRDARRSLIDVEVRSFAQASVGRGVSPRARLHL